MPKPEEWVSKKDPATGTEFGGVSGLIQPPPHDSPVWPTSETGAYFRSIPADEFDEAGHITSTYEAPPSTLVRP